MVMADKAKETKDVKWSEERLLFEIFQLLRTVVTPSPENLKRITEIGAQFHKVHPKVAEEIAKELQDRAKAEADAREEAAEQAKADAAAARGEAPKKNEETARRSVDEPPPSRARI
jgi:hypothetical protein